MEIFLILPTARHPDPEPIPVAGQDLDHTISLLHDNTAHTSSFRLLFGEDYRIRTIKVATASLRVQWQPETRSMLQCTIEQPKAATITYSFNGNRGDLKKAISACLENHEPYFEGRTEMIRSLDADLWTAHDGGWNFRELKDRFLLNIAEHKGFGRLCERLTGGVAGIRCEQLDGNFSFDLPVTTPIIRVLR